MTNKVKSDDSCQNRHFKQFPNLQGSTQDSDSFDLYEYLGDSWGCIFMHPGDYTPVCTTELGTAASYQEKFAERNVKLCGFSCNDSESHQGWIQDIKAATGQVVEFPMFCDPQRENAVSLGILDETNKDAKGLPMTVRSVFILKPSKSIALMLTYPASTGRNFDEIIRVIDSLQLTANQKVATPANWKNGEDVIVNFPLSDKDADEYFGEVRILCSVHALYWIVPMLLTRVSKTNRVDTALWKCLPRKERIFPSIISATRRILLRNERTTSQLHCFSLRSFILHKFRENAFHYRIPLYGTHATNTMFLTSRFRLEFAGVIPRTLMTATTTAGNRHAGVGRKIINFDIHLDIGCYPPFIALGIVP